MQADLFSEEQSYFLSPQLGDNKPNCLKTNPETDAVASFNVVARNVRGSCCHQWKQGPVENFISKYVV